MIVRTFIGGTASAAPQNVFADPAWLNVLFVCFFIALSLPAALVGKNRWKLFVDMKGWAALVLVATLVLWILVYLVWLFLHFLIATPAAIAVLLAVLLVGMTTARWLWSRTNTDGNGEW